MAGISSVGNQLALTSLLTTNLNKTNQTFAEKAEEASTGQKAFQNINPANLAAGLKAISQLASFQGQSSGLQVSQSAAAIQQGNLALANDAANDLQSLIVQKNSGFADASTVAAIDSAISATVNSLSSLVGPNASPFSGGGEIQVTDDSASALSDITITQTEGSSIGKTIDVSIDAVGTAAVATLTTPGGLSTFELNGVTVNFAGGSDADLAGAINGASSETGVTAAVTGPGQVTLTQETAGSQFGISIQDVQGAQFGAGETGQSFGTDASVTVNGAQATANGNDISFSNAGGVTGSFTVDSATVAGTTTDFTTQGGGSQFFTGSGTSVTVASPSLSDLQGLTNGGTGTLAGDLTILQNFQDSVINSQVQIATVQNAQVAAANQIEGQTVALTQASADLLGSNFAETVSALLGAQNQQQVQLSLISKVNSSVGAVLGLLD